MLFNNAKNRIAADPPKPLKRVSFPRLPLDEIEAKIVDSIASSQKELHDVETARKLIEDRLIDLHADLDLLHLARPMLERWLPAVPMRYGPGLRNALPEMFRTSHEWLTAQELTARLIETGYQFQRAETDSSKRASIYQTCRALVRSGILRTEISDGQAKFQLT